MEPRAWMRGEKGLQALEWIALALVALALLAALALGLKRTEAGPGEALSAAVSALFQCLVERRDCPLTAVSVEKASPCRMQPTTCLTRGGDCLLRGACEGADPKDLVGLLPWLAVVGIPMGGVVFALLPPWVRRRRWAWPRLPLRPPAGPGAGAPSLPRLPDRSRRSGPRRLLPLARPPGPPPLWIPPPRRDPPPRPGPSPSRLERLRELPSQLPLPQPQRRNIAIHPCTRCIPSLPVRSVERYSSASHPGSFRKPIPGQRSRLADWADSRASWSSFSPCLNLMLGLVIFKISHPMLKYK
jgi:hypothetical protein